MPAKKKYEKTLYVCVPTGTYNKIERLSKRDKVPRSKFVRNMIYKQLALYKEV